MTGQADDGMTAARVNEGAARGHGHDADSATAAAEREAGQERSHHHGIRDALHHRDRDAHADHDAQAHHHRDADRARLGEGVPRTAVVVVASNRAAAGIYEDETGPDIRDWLHARGWAATVVVVPDGDPVGAALREAIDGGADAVITTGGTGVSPTDRTPEQTRPHLDLELPGIAEEMRRVGGDSTPFALVSRGLAGVAGQTLVVNLPGSRGGVQDGLSVLGPLLGHLMDQIHGGDHARPL